MRIVASLDAWLALRDFAGDGRSDLVAAASLAELAGVDALRLSIQDEGGPVRETDVDALRRVARFFELCMPVSQTLLKVPLEARPDRVVLVGDRKESAGSAPPVDARTDGSGLGAVVRALEEAGLRTSVRVAPQIEAVRAIHALGVRDVELFTGHLVDLPEEERRGALVALGDTARLAAKLRLGLSLAGGLDEWNLREVLAAAPSVERVVLGRGLARRSLLVGVDRATRDLRERMS